MPAVVEFLKQPHDFNARARIEIAGRFVGEHQFRPVHQRAGDGDALLLAAGKLAGMMVEPVAEADAFQRLDRALAAFAQGNKRMRVEHRQLDVFQRRRAGQQIETLENEAEFLVSQFRQFLAVQPGDRHAVEQIISACRLVKAAERVHQAWTCPSRSRP